jgi:hypothetical protein
VIGKFAIRLPPQRPLTLREVTSLALELPLQWLSEITEGVRLRLEAEERWVTTDGLADWLGCDLGHVYDLKERGLPGHRVPDKHGRLSKKLYFSLREVSAWFEATAR